MPPSHGEICWLEIPVSDIARAQKFYTDVFEWTCVADGSPSPSGGISAIHRFSKGNLHGAMLVMNEGNHIANVDKANANALSILNTFGVRSIEDALAKAEKLGGKTHLGKTQISPEMGYFARVIDSEGNLIGVWAME